ncbi:MAG: undecaprenyl/decaprenyl-phosphate alpha-N-acetylglucosaminyl 1-phosphate transferase [Anaerolineae bacterium]|nr:undecaprenyl/decaprenyl-phosphate alpha-N-acetylglucosaminyl 1-phosphate transferase [Anaerolineae bacterium]
MITYLLIVAASLAFAVGMTPVARLVASRLGIVDHPTTARKIHVHPMPYLGGAAIYLAFVLALLLLGDRFYVNQVVGIFIGATLMSLLGLWDDRLGLSPYVKLAGHLVAAAILVLTDVRIGILRIPILNVGVTLLWIVWITNSINLLDNMDGLAGGVAGISAAFFALLAAQSGQYLVGALAAALLGACLGFLVYNFNPASIFMGDSGALFLGFVLAAVGIKMRFPDNVDIVTWMVPVLVLGLPIFDTTLVFFSRLRRGLNPLTTPGKDHVSHRLVLLGYTRREAVLICYFIASALGAIAFFVTKASVVQGYVVGALVALVGFWGIWRMERIRGVYEPERKN